MALNKADKIVFAWLLIGGSCLVALFIYLYKILGLNKAALLWTVVVFPSLWILETILLRRKNSRGK